MSLHDGKSAWLSGEICSRPGHYCSDSCGHEVKKEFTANDIFTRCPVCHQSVRWILVAERSRTQKTLTLSFDTRRDSFAFLHGRTRNNA